MCHWTIDRNLQGWVDTWGNKKWKELQSSGSALLFQAVSVIFCWSMAAVSPRHGPSPFYRQPLSKEERERRKILSWIFASIVISSPLFNSIAPPSSATPSPPLFSVLRSRCHAASENRLVWFIEGDTNKVVRWVPINNDSRLVNCGWWWM